MSQAGIRTVVQATGFATGLIQQVSATLNTPVIIDNNVSTPIGYDNTIPQSNEGEQVITATITPTNAVNLLYIRFECQAVNGETESTVALFQDAGVNAIAARNCDSQQEGAQVILTHIMVAGTTSATTFKVRFGLADAMTGTRVVLNGDNNELQLYGGVSNIVLYIYEIAPGVSSGPVFGWQEVVVAGPTQMSVNTGYIANSAVQAQLLLPAASAIGDSIKVQGKAVSLFKITQNVGQQIHYKAASTTAGVLGSLTSVSQWDSVELICITANTDWSVSYVAQAPVLA